MWPKILVELIPHISRLVPMADKFFSSRSATDDATQQAVLALRSDLAQTASTHAALYRQMNEQSERISEAAADARATRVAMESLDTRLAIIEQRLKLSTTLVPVLIISNIILAVILIALVVLHQSKR